jgi:NADH dehydrogenase [ubiquinone] 1 alpha subcomplex assembly factor 2
MVVVGSPPSSPSLRKFWMQWKSYKFFWRKKFLIGKLSLEALNYSETSRANSFRFPGSDLLGNTYWEFRDNLKQGRFRRIVQYSRQVHHSDVSVSPQWLQWLRHTRPNAPSLEEQQMDIIRQRRIKALASEADARWAAKPSFLVAPAQPAPGNKQQTDLDRAAAELLPHGNQKLDNPESRKDPWTVAKNPQADEPKPWTPTTLKRG